MADKRKRQNRIRLGVQIAFTALSNGYLVGFTRGRIFTGASKAYCVPGLNCYSCPGALGACPIGALQAVLGSRDYHISFFVLGFFMVIGAFFGRIVCGFLCPFGLVQDLLHKIPIPWKRRRLPGETWLRKLKYIVLAVFVIALPLLVVDVVGQGQPWFCKYICPSGTLTAGIPLVLLNEGLRSAIGPLFTWKVLVLAVVVILSMVIHRPFCRYLCPLGAVYGLFNPISLYRFEVDKEACIGCKVCQKACPMDIPVYETPNSPECIRCGACKAACPKECIHNAAGLRRKG